MGNLRHFDSAIISASLYTEIVPQIIFGRKPLGSKAFIAAPNQREARLFAEHAGFTDYVYVRDVYMLYGYVGSTLFIVDADAVHNLYGVLSYAQMRDFHVHFFRSKRE
jgi:hypothetical protein